MALPNCREIARRIEDAAPEAIHIATEGPIAARCVAIASATSSADLLHHAFPEYVSVRTGIPTASVTRAAPFHAVTDDDGRDRLVAVGAERGFRRLGF